MRQLQSGQPLEEPTLTEAAAPASPAPKKTPIKTTSLAQSNVELLTTEKLLAKQQENSDMAPLISKIDDMVTQLDTVAKLMQADIKRDTKMNVQLKLFDRDIRAAVTKIVEEMDVRE